MPNQHPSFQVGNKRTKRNYFNAGLPEREHSGCDQWQKPNNERAKAEPAVHFQASEDPKPR